MKKRLLITSIVMMLVVAVALSTATYAWFTSNANVSATAVVLTAATADGDAIMISHSADNTNLRSSIELTTIGEGLLYPATPLANTVFTTALDTAITNEVPANESEAIAAVKESLDDAFQNLIMKGEGTYIDPDISGNNVSYYTDTFYVFNKGTVAKALVPTITIYYDGSSNTAKLAAKSVRIALLERVGTEVDSGEVTFGSFNLRGIYQYDTEVAGYEKVAELATYDSETTYYTLTAGSYTAATDVTSENFATKKSGLYVVSATQKRSIAAAGANGSSTAGQGYGVVGNGPYTQGGVLFAPNTTFSTIAVPTSGHYVANSYTVVMWLEGWDEDCTNSITQGQFRVGLDFVTAA